MELTPFERLEAHRTRINLEVKAMAALRDLVEQSDEVHAQINYYQSLVLSGSEEDRKAEAPVTIEAIKDLTAINQAIIAICQNFGFEA